MLVRMKWDRKGGKRKRTNWLLIKHRDAAAHEGDDDAILKDPKSIASGRTLKEIALGTGKAPTPFMTGKKRGAGAVWQSNRKDGGDSAAPKAQQGQGQEGLVRCRRFVEPQLCQAGRARAGGGRLGARGQVRRLSHAAARRGRRGRAAHAQGPRLDGQVRGDRRGRREAAGLHHRRRGRWRSTSMARRISRRCRRRSRKANPKT